MMFSSPYGPPLSAERVDPTSASVLRPPNGSVEPRSGDRGRSAIELMRALNRRSPFREAGHGAETFGRPAPRPVDRAAAGPAGSGHAGTGKKIAARSALVLPTERKPHQLPSSPHPRC